MEWHPELSYFRDSARLDKVTLDSLTITQRLHCSIMSLVEESKTCQAALQLAKKHMHPSIFNHCMRVYLYASRRLSFPSVPLFIACILHDLGSSSICDGAQRFEVEGADKALELMEGNHESEHDCHDVWVAIAVHTCEGIAQRITPLASVVRKAVMIDFGQGPKDATDEDIEKEWPRLDIEKALGDAVVARCCVSPKTSAPRHSWPGDLYRAHLADPNNTGVNIAF